MKVLGICCSPRKKGNTASIIKQTLKGAAAQGAKTELVYLYEMNFKGCRACLRCKTKGICVFKDDLKSLCKKVAESDAIIFGSPIYYGDVTGVARCSMERILFPKLSQDLQPIIDRIRNTVLVFCQGNPNLRIYREIAEQTRQAFTDFGFNVIGMVMAAGGPSGQEAARHANVMKRAETLGKRLSA
jgi:multimeric flavodoxin WrbA